MCPNAIFTTDIHNNVLLLLDVYLLINNEILLVTCYIKVQLQSNSQLMKHISSDCAQGYQCRQCSCYSCYNTTYYVTSDCISQHACRLEDKTSSVCYIGSQPHIDHSISCGHRWKTWGRNGCLFGIADRQELPLKGMYKDA